MKTKFIELALLTFALAGMVMPASAFDFGDIGKALKTLSNVKDATTEIEEPQEIELGEGIASNLLGAAPLLKKPSVQQYVNQVGLWLALQTERPNLPWRFAVLDDSNINAFATPGGNIFITHGLLQRMSSEAELAGVLAHEIAHVLKKHHLQAIKKNARSSLLADAATLAVDRKGGNPAIAKLAGAGTELYARGLDKEDEFEADRMGVVIAARAGYDPFGLPAVLQILQGIDPQDSDLALMFKTHPTPADRLGLLDSLMASGFEGYDARPSLAKRVKAASGEGKKQ